MRGFLKGGKCGFRLQFQMGSNRSSQKYHVDGVSEYHKKQFANLQVT